MIFFLTFITNKTRIVHMGHICYFYHLGLISPYFLEVFLNLKYFYDKKAFDNILKNAFEN